VGSKREPRFQTFPFLDRAFSALSAYHIAGKPLFFPIYVRNLLDFPPSYRINNSHHGPIMAAAAFEEISCLGTDFWGFLDFFLKFWPVLDRNR